MKANLICCIKIWCIESFNIHFTPQTKFCVIQEQIEMKFCDGIPEKFSLDFPQETFPNGTSFHMKNFSASDNKKFFTDPIWSQSYCSPPPRFCESILHALNLIISPSCFALVRIRLNFHRRKFSILISQKYYKALHLIATDFSCKSLNF